MSRLDRLSALISRFAIAIAPAARDAANVVVYQDDNGRPSRVLFATRSALSCDQGDGAEVAFCAAADWGGDANPLLTALPPVIELDLTEDRDSAALIDLLRTEWETPRCGSGTVLNRLGEVLMVRLLRSQLRQGDTNPGLLAGLADPRLSRAIVALHEDPGRRWQNDELAEIAGLSRSRFTELFAELVGLTPMAYLRSWRMTLARQDVERGERIQTVARRYGYGSGEALTRSFRRQFGESPISLRPR